LCKDCDYRGSFILDDSSPGKSKPRGAPQGAGGKILISLDIILFCSVLLLIVFGAIATLLGLATLFAWIIVFLMTMLYFTAHYFQGADDWYQYGITFIAGILAAMVLGLVLGYDVYGITLLMPFAIMGVFAINWMFTDRSEEAINKDLEKLRREMR
jgi:L-asparagine transporter-like permease